jgi:hypothetical protein
MSRVEEIERAIAELSPDEFLQVAQRVNDIEAERWESNCIAMQRPASLTSCARKHKRTEKTMS